MIDVKKLDLKTGDILAVTFDDDLDGDTFERVAEQLSPVCAQLGVLALFLERATPVVVRPEDGAIIAIDRESLITALETLLDKESIGDHVYSVRDKALASGDGFTGNAWHHPRVSAYSHALQVLETLRTALKPAPVPEEA